MNRKLGKILLFVFIMLAPVQAFSACIDTFTGEDFKIACGGGGGGASGFISSGVCAIERNVASSFGTIYCTVVDNPDYANMVTAAMLLYVIFAGLTVVMNLGMWSITDMVAKVATLVIIYGITARPDIMLETIYPFIIGAPLELASWLTGSEDNVVGIIASMEDALFNFFDLDGSGDFGMKDFMSALFAYSFMPFGIFLIMLAILCLLVFFLIRSYLVSIISLMFLVMVSPVIFVGHLFGATRGISKNWLEYIVSFMIQPVIVLVLIALLFGVGGRDGFVSREIDDLVAMITNLEIEDVTYTLQCVEAEHGIENLAEPDKLEVDAQNCDGAMLYDEQVSPEETASQEFTNTVKMFDDPVTYITALLIQILKILAITLAMVSLLNMLGDLTTELSSWDPRQVSTIPRTGGGDANTLLPDADDDGDGDDFGGAKDSKLYGAKRIKRAAGRVRSTYNRNTGRLGLPKRRVKSFAEAYTTGGSRNLRRRASASGVVGGFALASALDRVPGFGGHRAAHQARAEAEFARKTNVNEMHYRYHQDYIRGDKVLGRKRAEENLAKLGINVNEYDYDKGVDERGRFQKKDQGLYAKAGKKFASTKDRIGKAYGSTYGAADSMAKYANERIGYGDGMTSDKTTLGDANANLRAQREARRLRREQERRSRANTQQDKKRKNPFFDDDDD